MNHAQLALWSLEKTAGPKTGLVMAALEAATGAIAGGAMGVMTARKGRRGDPLGPSDISGALYGGTLGALAGLGAGQLLRSSAVRKGISDDHRLKSMAEHISHLENSAMYKNMKASQFAAVQNRDALSQKLLGATMGDMEKNLYKHRLDLQNQMAEGLMGMRNAQPGTPEHLQASIHYARAKKDLAQFNNSAEMAAFKDARKNIDALNKIDMTYRKADAARIKEDLDLQKSLLEEARKRAVLRQQDEARGMFFGMKL